MIALAQLRSRLGDFWWYTDLQFGAARCGDFINEFIGLWLVPKYVGQSSAPAFQILASVFAFRKELGRAVKAELFWTKAKVREMFGYMLWGAVAKAVGGLVQFVEPLVIRQRLPDVDSAAYCMISRFAEIGTYLGLTLSGIVFPYVSEAAEPCRPVRRIPGRMYSDG